MESGADYYRTRLHGPALLRTCGDIVGKQVIDIGCGQGWFSRRRAEAGAQVTGVDISTQQIAKAKRHERDRPLGIEYRRLDAAALAGAWDARTFDLATACMAL